jgi:PTH1 family peptidyl-tRNA hydrolase
VLRLIVGLGNPGREYEKSRHNAGFLVVDRLASRHGLPPPKARFHADCSEGAIAGCRVLVLKPMTYMNRSGTSVREAAQFYKISPDDVLVIVDDIDLPCGRIRLRPGGSAGGHNGLSDIELALQSRDYPRLRVGIDPPGRIPQRDYVLGRFTPEQWEKVDPALDRAADCAECWLGDDLDRVMGRFNGPA